MVRQLRDALDAERAAYVEAHPQSRAAAARAREVMPGGSTRTTLHFDPFPLQVVGGAGSRSRCADGHSYVDLLGDYTAGLFGHSHPVIRETIERTLDHGWSFGAVGPGETRLAEILVDRFPSIEQVRFTNSGTEADLMAVTAARACTGRQTILVFRGSYHGGLMSYAVGDRTRNVTDDVVVGTYNDVDETRALIAECGGDLAGVLVEPMLGSGGCVPATDEFLQMLRDETARVGAVLIFDEVMTSRHAGGGEQARRGIVPDLTTLGKYVGGGMTCGAFGGRADIMGVFDPAGATALPHAGTFNNNVFTMAAGAAGLTDVFTPEVAAAHFERGERLRVRLNEICRDVDLSWTGLGSTMNVHPTSSPITSGADVPVDPDARELVHLHLIRQGFLLARRGMVALSLVVTDEEIDAFVQAVADLVAEHGAVLGQPH